MKVKCELLRTGDYLNFTIEALETMERVLDVSLFEMLAPAKLASVRVMFAALPAGLMDCYPDKSYDQLRREVVEAYGKIASPQAFQQLFAQVDEALGASFLFEHEDAETGAGDAAGK